MRFAATVGLLAAVLSLGLAVPALAQGTPAPKEEKAGARASEQKLEPVTGEKVEIILRSGVPIRGVVRGHRVELHHDTRYIPSADRKARGAGIRVFYAMGLNGFIFVPYSTVDEIEFRGTLTEAEGLELAKSLKNENDRAEKERAAAAAEMELKKAAAVAAAEDKAAAEKAAAEKPAPKPEEVTPSIGGGKQSDPLAAIEDSNRMFNIRELLKRFPPAEWKPSRLDEIKRRAIILNIYPSGEESAFMEKYDLWLEGYELWKKAQEVSGKKPEAEKDITVKDGAKTE